MLRSLSINTPRIPKRNQWKTLEKKKTEPPLIIQKTIESYELRDSREYLCMAITRKSNKLPESIKQTTQILLILIFQAGDAFIIGPLYVC